MADEPGEPDPAELIGSGEFAQRTQLSRKALRLYSDNGLLVPHEVDAWNGYRRYAPDQVQTGRLIGLLRGADLSLAEIQQVLAAVADGRPQEASAQLDAAAENADRIQRARLLVIRHAQSILTSEGPGMFEIHTRQIPAQRLLSIQTRLTAERTDAFVAEAKAAFRRHLEGQAPAGPFTLIFHGPVSPSADGPIEAALPVTDDIHPGEQIGIRTEAAHAQAYTTITKAQWGYPAILAAYDAVACSTPVRDRGASALSCREIYLAEPDAIAEEDLICEIAYPLA